MGVGGRGRFRAQTGRRLLARRTSQISSVSGIMSLPVAPERRYSTNSATRKAHAPVRGVSFAGPGTEARDFQGPTGVGLGVNYTTYLDRPAVSSALFRPCEHHVNMSVMPSVYAIDVITRQTCSYCPIAIIDSQAWQSIAYFSASPRPSMPASTPRWTYTAYSHDMIIYY